MKTKQPVRRGTAHGPVPAVRNHATTLAILGPDFGHRATGRKGKIPSKWAKHYRRLLELRARLEKERMGHAQAASQPLETYSMDMADAATDEFDHVLNLTALSTEHDALYEVDEALKRIMTGTYGICQLTGEPIPQKRLEVLPWTRFASEAERQLELQGQARAPRLGELGSVMGPPSGNLEPIETSEDEPELPPTDEVLSRAVPNPGLDLSGRGRSPSADRSVTAAASPVRTRSHKGPRPRRTKK